MRQIFIKMVESLTAGVNIEMGRVHFTMHGSTKYFYYVVVDCNSKKNLISLNDIFRGMIVELLMRCTILLCMFVFEYTGI